MKNNKIKLSPNEVDARLVHGEMVHTFEQSGFMWLGADMKRERILELAEKFGAEEAGEIASKMNHGIVVWDDKEAIFCETK